MLFSGNTSLILFTSLRVDPTAYFVIDRTRITPKIIDEIMMGVFHSGNCLTGISSISRAALNAPRSTGVYPMRWIKFSTFNLASLLSPA